VFGGLNKEVALMALTPKQRIFVDEYLIDHNGSAAAVRARYNKRSAKQTAFKILQEPEVAAAIADAEAARALRTQVDQDWVLRRLVRIADSDIRKLFNGRDLKLPGDLDDDTAFAVASIEVVTVAKGFGEVENIAKVKFWDKRGALIDIGRHLGMFKDKLDVEHSGNVTVVLNGDEALL
jgi:phage terminase small subunit